MKKLMIAAVVGGLLVGSMVAPASAKKAKPKAKPVPMTYFFHGPWQAGEIDEVEGLANAAQSIPDGFQVMDASEPADPAPKSMGLTNYVRGPNRTCSGNGLFPTWQGSLNGKVSGDLKVYVNAVSAPGPVIVEVFADSLGGCESSLGSTGYVEPVASIQTTLTPGPGETEIVLEDVAFTSVANVVIMISPAETAVGPETVLDPTSQGRVLYDSADYASRIEFTCTPTTGKTCIPEA